MSEMDTIFALSSAPGKAGVAVVRISGKDAFEALQHLNPAPLPPPRVATLMKLYREDGTLLDHALVICFPAPASFTGEDVVELHLHGSLAVTRACIGRLSAMPHLRLAEPGEFTRRAFDAGKFDLLEVEALADIIDAETDAQLRQAFRQLEGHMGRNYMLMRASIVEALALLEAYIDFPEEDIPEEVLAQIHAGTLKLMSRINHVLTDNSIGERIRSGFRVAIIGAPNVGKSSLLNALAKRDAAIVSPIPGTTRDVIELHIDIGDFPVVLSDTAGIRETDDVIENMGIIRSREALAKADIILVLLDASDLQKSMEILRTGDFSDIPQKIIVCVNKADLSDSYDKIIKQCMGYLSASKLKMNDIIAISAGSGANLDGLEKLLADSLNALQPAEEPLITQTRHRALLETARFYLDASLSPLPIELRCEELRLAAVSIGKISGIILPDELLGAIFSKFCIGK